MLGALFPAAEALRMLAELAQDGQVRLSPDLVIAAPPITLTQVGAYWQERIPLPAQDHLVDVLEPAAWRYLHLAYSEQRIDSNDFDRQARLTRALEPDLARRNVSSFGALVSLRFARGQQQPNQYGADRFGYGFDFPLALTVEHGALDRHTGTLRLTIRLRRPLAPDTLQVALGDHWSSDAAALPVEAEVERVDDWSIAGINVPYHCGGVTLHAPPLVTWLPHQVAAPSALEQARGAVSRLYTRAAHEATSTGTARWERAARRARKGAHFEVALANALARLGIPLLFGGQVERDVLMEHRGQLERAEEVGGPATPGVDLVALDPLERRATAISAKANTNSPSDDEIQALLDAVVALRGELIGWTVFGVLACRAPRTRLGRFLARDDMRVWGREDLESIAAAESAVAIRDLLWRPPWTAVEDGWSYFLGYLPPLGR